MAWFSSGSGSHRRRVERHFRCIREALATHELSLVLISGVFFMVDWLPASVRELILWVPMVHGNEMVRHGFFGSVVTTYENP